MNYDRVFTYDYEGRLTKIDHDDGQTSDTRYEYTYTGDGVRYLKKDHTTNKEYRYGCSIDCGGTPLRVYERTLGSQGSWTSVEDYMQAGKALGYGMNWQYSYSGSDLVMMGESGSPAGNFPRDTNGLAVDSPLQPCACPDVVPTQTTVCGALVYGGCDGGACEENPSFIPPTYLWNIDAGIITFKLFSGIRHGNWCGPAHPLDRFPDPGGGIKVIPFPIDALDSCCFNHDDCYEVNNCTGCKLFSLQCCLCDGSLWRCAARVDCRHSPFPKTCWGMKALIGLLPTVRSPACFLLAP